ncbi:unnamed protein product [Cylindrotheca closterium]|uniref:Uncharacterized protein n=1 Tax=Cylindrotheca closterium TaxID=2856 RepID=A0AAD2JM63_9STRA|nr:unnamed protein product [Cylindrotheca closterium]
MVRHYSSSTVTANEHNNNEHNNNNNNHDDDDPKDDSNNNNAITTPTRRLLIVGYGRVGQQVAAHAAAAATSSLASDDTNTIPWSFDQIVGTTRNNNNDDDDDNDSTSATTVYEDDDDDCNISSCTVTTIPISDLLNPPGTSTTTRVLLQDDYYSHVLIAMPPVEEIYQAILDSFFLCNNITNYDDGADSNHDKNNTTTTKNNNNDTKWLGMVSTTGVYGNHHGEWVTEESELRCNSAAGGSTAKKNYVQWEQAFQKKATLGKQQQQHRVRVRVFRCAGIYDSTKSALHTLWKKQQKLPRDNEAATTAFQLLQDNQPSTQKGKQEDSTTSTTIVESKTNRIHVADIAQAIVNSMMMMMEGEDEEQRSNSSPFEIYNLSDDLPERRSKVMEYASNLLTNRLGETWTTRAADSEELGLSNDDDDSSSGSSGISSRKKDPKMPKKESAGETKSIRRTRREQEPKLIDNQKLKRTLLPELAYPTYKEGLDAILLDPQAPWNQNKNSEQR